MLQRIYFYSGMRVLIAPDAFPGSDESVDVRAREKRARLTYLLDDNSPLDDYWGQTLWQAVTEDGDTISPIEGELFVL